MNEIANPKLSIMDEASLFGIDLSDLTELYVTAILCALAGLKEISNHVLNGRPFKPRWIQSEFSKSDVLSLLEPEFTPDKLLENLEPYNAHATFLIAMIYYLNKSDINGFVDYINKLINHSPDKNNQIWAKALICITKYYGLDMGLIIHQKVLGNLIFDDSEIAVEHFKGHIDPSGIHGLTVRYRYDKINKSTFCFSSEIKLFRPHLYEAKEIAAIKDNFIKEKRDKNLIIGLFEGYHLTEMQHQLNYRDITLNIIQDNIIIEAYKLFVRDGRFDLAAWLANNNYLPVELPKCLRRMRTGHEDSFAMDILEIATLINDPELSKTILYVHKHGNDQTVEEQCEFSKQIKDMMHNFSLTFQESKKLLEFWKEEPQLKIIMTFDAWIQFIKSQPGHVHPIWGISDLVLMIISYIFNVPTHVASDAQAATVTRFKTKTELVLTSSLWHKPVDSSELAVIIDESDFELIACNMRHFISR